MKLSRRVMLTTAAAGCLLKLMPSTFVAQASEKQQSWWKTTPMDAITAMRTRRSIRDFTDQAVSDELLNEIIAAGTSAPSAGNEQPWKFVVLRDKKLLAEAATVSKFATPAGKAPVTLVVCGDKSLEKFPGYWSLDLAACTQNILLAAHALGLGAVWLGVYPDTARVETCRQLIKAPESITPFALIPIGYPKEQIEAVNRFDSKRIYLNSWENK